MSATQALKVVIIVVLVGGVTKTVRGKKGKPQGGQSDDPVTASPNDPKADGGQKPKPIRTGKEN